MPLSLGKSIILIDQVPLFKESASACEREYARIAELKVLLHRYETRDLPAYERWYHTGFGALLTQLRELGDLVYEKEIVCEELRKKHWVRFFSDEEIRAELHVGREEDEEREPRERMRSQGARGPAWDIDENGEEFVIEDDFQEADRFYDDEDVRHFSEDRGSVREFEEMMKRGAEKSQPGRRRRAEGESYAGEAGRASRHFRDSVASDLARETLAPDTRSRVKERYRILVRKLHPDLNPDVTPEQKSLWFQAQEAYKANDLEKLDVILALSDAILGRFDEIESLAQLRRAKKEIERLVQPLIKRVEDAKNNRAWGFEALTDRRMLQIEIEAELREDLSDLKKNLDHVQARIARFTRGARDRSGTSPFYSAEAP